MDVKRITSKSVSLDTSHVLALYRVYRAYAYLYYAEAGHFRAYLETETPIMLQGFPNILNGARITRAFGHRIKVRDIIYRYPITDGPISDSAIQCYLVTRDVT